MGEEAGIDKEKGFVRQNGWVEFLHGTGVEGGVGSAGRKGRNRDWGRGRGADKPGKGRAGSTEEILDH